MASLIGNRPPNIDGLKNSIYFMSTPVHFKKKGCYDYTNQAAIFSSKFLNDYDDEDGLSIKSGGTISSGDDSVASMGYEEIKEILMNKKKKEKTTWSDNSDSEWANKNLIKATAVQGEQQQQRIANPDKRNSKLSTPLNTTTTTTHVATIHNHNQNTNHEKPLSQYQHFNNWKLHLLTYKQNKGYLTRRKPYEAAAAPPPKTTITNHILPSPLSIVATNRNHQLPPQQQHTFDVVDTYGIPNNSLNTASQVSSIVASANYFDTKKFNATSSTANSVLITKAPTVVNIEDRSRNIYDKRDDDDPYRPQQQQKDHKNETITKQYAINSLNVNLQISVNKVPQSRSNIPISLQVLRDCNRKEKHVFDVNSQTNIAPVAKLPSIREQHQLRIKKQNTKENNFFKQFEKLPSMRSFLSSKNASIIKTQSKNANIALLSKVNTFAKQKLKSLGVTKPSIMPLSNDNYQTTAPSDPHLKAINEYHEITKILTNNNNKRKRRTNETDIHEPKEDDFEMVKKHNAGHSNVFQVLRKDQRRIIAFYHRVNENENLNFPSQSSFGSSAVASTGAAAAAAATAKIDHFAYNRQKQKIYI